MSPIGLVLLVFAFVCAVLATVIQYPASPGPYWARVHLGWAALAFLIAAMLFGGLKL